MLHNFALILHGESVVHDVIVATDDFFVSVSPDWKSQWAHTINVDGLPCGPGWTYDVSSGTFSPPTEET